MTSSISKLDKNFEIPNVEMTLDWYDLATMQTESQGWPGEAPGRYGRLPAKAQAAVREPVWQLGMNSAGLAVRFVTDSTNIAASWDVTKPELQMTQMTLTGTSGLDLYVWQDNRWRWCGVGIPKAADKTDNADNAGSFVRKLVGNLIPGKRTYMLYLPLYNGVSAVRIGVNPDSCFEDAPARPAGKDKPICFYGTSILQGGCATRPGMAYPSIIGRYLDMPQINLGFPGNGKLEPEVADLVAEIDACMFVLDPLPNNDPSGVMERGEPFIRKIRIAHPAAPVVMIENVLCQHAHIQADLSEHLASKNTNWRAIFDKLISEGDKNLYYIPNDDLYGHDDEATIDGTHATDLGFYRMAQVIAPVLKNILQGKA